MKKVYYNVVSQELASFEETPPYPWIRVVMPHPEEPEPVEPPKSRAPWMQRFLMIMLFPMVLNLAIVIVLTILNAPLYISLPAGFFISSMVSFIIGMEDD